MNKIKLIAVILMLPLFSLYSQDKGIKEVVIQTSAQCEMCKERIEKELAFTKGVKSANLDLETKEVTVKYKSNKTTADDIRKAIASVGYDADDVPADKKAYEELPACCKKGGH